MYARWGYTITVSTPAEFNSALSTIRSSTDNYFVVTITADFSLSPQNLTLEAYRNKTITLKGNVASRTINLSGQGSLFTIGTDVKLILENIVLQGRSDNNTSLVNINSGGTLEMNEGAKIIGNTGVYTPGGVAVWSGGRFIMYGGEISGNTAHANNEGAVHVVKLGGGGVGVEGTFIMHGGVISGNTALASGGRNPVSYGGGVYVWSGGTFTMGGGVIYGNTAGNGADLYRG